MFGHNVCDTRTQFNPPATNNAAAQRNAEESRRTSAALSGAGLSEANEREAIRALWEISGGRERFSCTLAAVGATAGKSERWAETWLPRALETQRRMGLFLIERTRVGKFNRHSGESHPSAYNATNMVKLITAIDHERPVNLRACAVVGARIAAELRTPPPETDETEAPARVRPLPSTRASLRRIERALADLHERAELEGRDVRPLLDRVKELADATAELETTPSGGHENIGEPGGETTCPVLETAELAVSNPEPEPAPSTLEAADSAVSNALRAGEAFAAAGADRFLVGVKNDDSGDWQAHELDAPMFADSLPELLAFADEAGASLIVRPLGVAGLVHIDDVTEAERRELAGYAFLTVETSENSGHAFIQAADSVEARAIRDGILTALRGRGDTKANHGSSGSVRWPGSCNRKPERRHADGSYPLVRVMSFQPGQTVTLADLRAAGLVGEPSPEPERPSPVPPGSPDRFSEPRAWPDYGRCLAGAPKASHGGADRSAADLCWAGIALSWGHHPEAVAARLAELSSKARGRRDPLAYSRGKVAAASRRARI